MLIVICHPAFQFVEFLRESLIRPQHLLQTDEGPHDGHIDLDRPLAAEYMPESMATPCSVKAWGRYFEWRPFSKVPIWGWVNKFC